MPITDKFRSLRQTYKFSSRQKQFLKFSNLPDSLQFTQTLTRTTKPPRPVVISEVQQEINFEPLSQ